MTDACAYAGLPAADPASLACDYGGMYETHACVRCLSWSAAVQAMLDRAASVAELRGIWEPLADAGEVDSLGGAEYHHALAHLRSKLLSRN
jgi:hypothetical protein